MHGHQRHCNPERNEQAEIKDGIANEMMQRFPCLLADNRGKRLCDCFVSYSFTCLPWIDHNGADVLDRNDNDPADIFWKLRYSITHSTINQNSNMTIRTVVFFLSPRQKPTNPSVEMH